MSNEGKKFDSGKAMLSLLPFEALEGAAKALSFGIEKYGRYNFTEGLSIDRIIDGVLRHVNQYSWISKEDPETGLSHLDHALAGLMMAKWMEVNHPEMSELYTDKKRKKKNDKKN